MALHPAQEGLRIASNNAASTLRAGGPEGAPFCASAGMEPEAGAAHIECLPDDLLSRIFGHLPFNEGFYAWLVAHAAGHVQDLELRVGTPYREDPEGSRGAFFPEVVAALAACGAGGSLQRLRLYLQFLPELRLPAALVRALGSLRSLKEESDVLAPQMAALTRLRELSLEAVNNGLEGYAALNALGGCLQRLHLNFCSWLPPPSTFAALSRLTMLSLDTVGEQREAFEEFEGSIEAVLRALPQLRHLRLSYASSGYSMDVPCLPRALTTLHNLTSFWWDVDTTEDATLPEPQGAWLSGLRRLALPDSLLFLNEFTLVPATPRLESLHILLKAWASLANSALALAVRHPTLGSVPLEGFELLPSAQSALQAAREERPDVRFTSDKQPLFKAGAAFDEDACRG
ncbi:hypothetical protein ABPG75_012527 [Micractinium tetrahymenae]